MNPHIERLDRDFEEITTSQTAYYRNFYGILMAVQKENHLDGTVLRKNNGKTERGELRIVENKCYNGNPGIPCYFTFHPYRNNGELSNAHRADKFEASIPSAYFAKILEIYSAEK